MAALPNTTPDWWDVHKLPRNQDCRRPLVRFTLPPDELEAAIRREEQLTGWSRERMPRVICYGFRGSVDRQTGEVFALPPPLAPLSSEDYP